MPVNAAFSLENVQVGLGSRAVLQQITLAAPVGGVMGLIGRNGAGKSTLLRLLAGREARYTGEAKVFDRKLPEAASGTVYLTADHWPYAGDQRVRDVARHISRVHPNFDMERAKELLAWFDVPGSRHPLALSRGQRTAAFLSLALATRAPLTLLDEPYSGLDVPARARFTRVLVEELRLAPRSLVISTHLVDEAEPLFHRVAMLEGGRITAADTVTGLVNSFTRVSGPVTEVDALPRLGRLDRVGSYASAIVRKGSEGSLTGQPVTLRELADLLIGPRRDALVDEEGEASR